MTPSMTTPIYEPELNFLCCGCPCGSRFDTEGDLALHQRETCPRKFDPSFKFPAAVPHWFELPDARGVADGGRKT
jgi:hypothetical protein